MKWVIFAIELAFFLYWAVFIITQVIVPLQKGTKLFPYFRSKEARKEVTHLLTEIEKVTDEEAIEALRKDLLKRRAKPSSADTQTPLT